MKLRRISLAVLFVLLSAIAALSGFMVYTQLSDRQKEKEEFDTLAEMVEVTPEKPNDETAVPTDDTSEPAGSVRAVCTKRRLHRLAVYSRYAAKLLKRNSVRK